MDTSGDGRRATGDGRRATGDGRRATGDGRRAVLFAARSAIALYRLLDVLPVFAGDERVSRVFTLVPGSDFGVDALAAIERVGAHTVPWDEACRTSYDLIVTASPKGALHLLRGPRVLLPHGAGFGKTFHGEGSAGEASGLDPEYLVPDGGPPPALHALAHPSQIDRLAALSPQAAARATVVGDPTLERILASLPLRDSFRAALGTGGRRLVVLTSTWGEESLLQRRATLPGELAARLPQDAYQLALIVHPNQWSRTGEFDLSEQLAPALDAGMILARPHEEWASILVAADAVITDHGSTALYYAAALDGPVLAAYDGGHELIPGSPMAELLTQAPRLDRSGDLEEALGSYRAGTGRAAATSAFTAAKQDSALGRLRHELYRLLDLAPPAVPVAARLLPIPAPPSRTPSAFAVRVRLDGDETHIERFPSHFEAPAHHLAAEYGAAGEGQLQSAALLYRRTGRTATAAPYSVAWTVAGWTSHALDSYPGCRTAAAVLSPTHCVVRGRGSSLLSVRIEPPRENGRIVHSDPAAVLSAVHARLAAPDGQVTSVALVNCVIGDRRYAVRLSPATAEEAGRVL
ncbi:translation initiation factor 2 [Streptomyces sp. NPDC057137]|uniref:translation initiation factor 2 n=1 Tax=Streptomyces sp. NPDC057137 TaxID=3346030 RepID=UPI0036262F85